jgi:protoporphyrin/coproporphyrin ferrochelatase
VREASEHPEHKKTLSALHPNHPLSHHTVVASQTYDALLFVSFGGPECREDVVPFLENVLRGKPVPRERMLEVAEHYYHYDGKSPINGHNRALIAALTSEFAVHGPELPIYWGNRNWHPTLPDALTRMRDDGVKRALAFVTSAYSSYSGCRQYRENIEAARAAVRSGAPEVDKLRAFFNHPGFIAPMIENLQVALDRFSAVLRPTVDIVFTAHSIPMSMARTSRYTEQLNETARLVAAGVGRPDYSLVYQSRSGAPSIPWLEPDICDYLRSLGESKRTPNVVIVPIGFISDHMEVIYDLDNEAAGVAGELDLTMVRAATVGTHPRFVSMIRELVLDRMDSSRAPLSLGVLGPSHDVCPADCCPRPVRPSRPATAELHG